MVDRIEAVVVGAGPAGCATALHLADRGHTVALLDRDRPDRINTGGKVCGEGLMPHGLAALRRLGLDPGSLGQPFLGIAYHAGEHRAVGSFPGGLHGIGLRRARLDPALRGLVAAHPRIRLRRGIRVTGLSGSPGHMSLETSAGPLEAQVVVGADGLHSTIRRLVALAAPARGPLRYGARQHLRLAPGQRAPDRVEVHALDGLELYVTPVGPDEVNLALLFDRTVARSLRGDRSGSFRRLIERCPEGRRLLEGADPLSEVGVCGPLRQRVRGCVADGVVLVGDAAGFVDAVTGEGMSLSLLSAELAAQAVSVGLRTGRLDRRALRPYGIRRARLARSLCWFTEIVVWGLRRPRLARAAIGGLQRQPRAFEAVLAVQTGYAPLHTLAPVVPRIVAELVRTGLGGLIRSRSPSVNGAVPERLPHAATPTRR